MHFNYPCCYICMYICIFVSDIWTHIIVAIAIILRIAVYDSHTICPCAFSIIQVIYFDSSPSNVIKGIICISRHVTLFHLLFVLRSVLSLLLTSMDLTIVKVFLWFLHILEWFRIVIFPCLSQMSWQFPALFIVVIV